MKTKDNSKDSIDALFAEIEADLHAGAAAHENAFRRRLGQAFEDARKNKGLSVRVLAKKMETSLSQVQRLLHAHVGGSLTLRTVFRAAHVLDLDVTAHIRDRARLTDGDCLQFGAVAWSDWNTTIHPHSDSPRNGDVADLNGITQTAAQPWHISAAAIDTLPLRRGTAS